MTTPRTHTDVPSGHVNARPTEIGVAPGSVYVQAMPRPVTEPPAGVRDREPVPAGIDEVDEADAMAASF
jgi:hypothetical protein